MNKISWEKRQIKVNTELSRVVNTCLSGKQQVHHFANKYLSSQIYDFSSSHVRVGPSRRLSAKELMLLSRGVGEDS